MLIRRATLETCAAADGLVVVIDVLRAFTTAAFLFNAGVEEITLVATVEEALALKQADPSLILLGEVGGRPIDGFDYGNSPSVIQNLDLRGRRAVQRTSAGTQGVVRSTGASAILMCSLVVAGATLNHIRQTGWQTVTFVPTELNPSGGDDTQGDEDAACADLLEDGLLGRQTNLDEIRRRVRASKSGRNFTSGARPDLPPQDLELALQIDRFNFVMSVERRGGLWVARARG